MEIAALKHEEYIFWFVLFPLVASETCSLVTLSTLFLEVRYCFTSVSLDSNNNPESCCVSLSLEIA